MKMTDPVPQFSYLVEKLKEHSLGFLHLVESQISGNVDIEATEKLDFAVKIWGRTSPIVLAGGFKPDSAKMAVDQEHKDYDIIIAFGRYFIANPNLPFRIQKGILLTPYDRKTFYTAKLPGYLDYPFSEQYLETQRS